MILLRGFLGVPYSSNIPNFLIHSVELYDKFRDSKAALLYYSYYSNFYYRQFYLVGKFIVYSADIFIKNACASKYLLLFKNFYHFVKKRGRSYMWWGFWRSLFLSKNILHVTKIKFLNRPTLTIFLQNYLDV